MPLKVGRAQQEAPSHSRKPLLRLSSRGLSVTRLCPQDHAWGDNSRTPEAGLTPGVNHHTQLKALHSSSPQEVVTVPGSDPGELYRLENATGKTPGIAWGLHAGSEDNGCCRLPAEALEPLPQVPARRRCPEAEPWGRQGYGRAHCSSLTGADYA